MLCMHSLALVLLSQSFKTYPNVVDILNSPPALRRGLVNSLLLKRQLAEFAVEVTGLQRVGRIF